MDSQPPAYLFSLPPVHLVSLPPVHLDSLPLTHLGSQPTTHLDSQPSLHLGSQPTTHLDSQPSLHLGSQPPTHLGLTPPAHLFSLPSIHLVSLPPVHLDSLSPAYLSTSRTPSHTEYLGISSNPAIIESPTRTQPPTHLGSAPPAHLVSLPPIHLVSLPPVHLDPPSPAYLSTTRTPSHPEYLGISSTPGIVEIPTRTQPPTHLCSPSLAHLGSLPPAHLGSLPPSHLGSLPPANLGPLPSAHLDTLGTPSPRVNSDISRKEPQSPYPGTSETYKFPDSPRPPSQYIIPGTSDTLDTSGHQNDTSETQPYPVYSETPETYNTSSRQDIPGNHGTSETHPEYHDTSDIPSRQDTSEYDDNSDTSRILTYSRYPVIPRPTISPDRQRPLERDRTRTSLSRVDNSGYRRKSGGKQHAEYPDTSERSNRPNIPSYPPYPLHLSYNGSLRYPSAYPRILGTNGRPGLFGKPNYPIHVRYPSYFNGPEGPVGPKGPIDDIGDIGDVGGDGEAGPDGPWPTGSPGPDGPWPGDPDYYSSVIHSAKSRSRGPVKILRLKSYTPINISSSIKTDFPGQINLKSLIKSNIASAINNDKLSEVSYPIKVSKIVDLDHSKIKTQEYEQIDEGNVNHNAKEINSLMHDTLKTSDHLKDTFSKNLEKDEITDKSIKTYGLKIERKQNNQYEVIEDIKRAEEPKEDLEEFPVHRQKQYRKEYKFSANHTFASQDIIKDALEQPYEINHQGSRLIVHTKFDRNEENKRRENIDSPENETIAIMEQVNTSSEGEQRDHRINATGVQPPHLVNIKSFSLPLGPNPQACPCYLVESHKENDITRSTTSTPPLIGQLGFIPVIFIPYCPGNKADSHKMKLMYPSATPIPYPCNACTTSGENIETKLLGLQLDQLGNIENLKGVLSVANLGFLNVPIRNVVEKRKIRNRKVV